MNNIYKVIWSKAKNCYVVASEIARSHTKSATGSEKIGGVTRRSLLASLMALSLLCGGLGVASAVDVVHVDESASGGIAGVYTTTKVDTLLKDKADKTALDGKADKGEVDTNKAAIQTLETGKANTSLNNLDEAGKSVIKTMMTDELEKKADATNVYTKDEVNTAVANVETKLADYAKTADVYTKTDVDGKLANKADKATTLTGYGITDAYTRDATDTAITTKVNEEKNARELKDNELSGRIDTLSTTVDSKVSKSDLNTNYYTQAQTNAAIKTAVDDEKNARDTAIKGEVTERNKAIGDAIASEVTNRDAAITKAKKELQEKVTEEETARKEEDAKLEEKIKENTTAINNEKAEREAADIALSDRIGTVDADGKYIKKSGTNNVSENLKVLDDQAKKNADAITAEETARTNKDNELEGKIKTNADNIQANKEAIVATDKRTGGITRNDAATTIEGHVTVDNLGNVTAKGQLTGKGVDAGDGTITTKGAVNAGSLTVENASNLKGDVTMDKKLAVTGDTSLKKTDVDGTLNVTGESSLKDTQVNGTLTTTGKATFKEAVEMDKGLTVTNGDTTLKGTKVDGKLTVTDDAELENTTVNGTLGVTGATTLSGELTAEKNAIFEKDVTVDGTTNLKNTTVTGDLKVTGTITTDRMVFGDKATDNYTEIDKGHITSKNDALADDATKKSSSMELDHSKLEVAVADKDSNGHLTMTADKTSIKNSDLAGKNYSEIVADKDSVKTTVKDEEDNTTSTKSSATEIRNYAKDAAGNKTNNVQTATQNKSWAKDKDGNESSIVQTGKDITNTAQNGTITNEAQNILNNATGDMTNTVGGKLTTTVTGQATEDFNGGLDTNVKGTENHTVTGNQNIHVTKNQTNKIDGDQENTIGGKQTTTVDGKVTENYKAGQETNVTGDQDIKVSGTQTTTATDINRNASSGMIDTVENASGSNKETKVAGQTTTDVKLASGEEGHYIRGATESRDYLLNGTLKNSETKTAEATSSEVTDGTNKASTIQDAKNLAGSVTNGTETGISGIHANNDGSVSIDSTVVGGGMSSVINQKKDSIQSAVGDGTNSTVIRQDKDNVAIASSNGTVAIAGKDIVNNASNSITDKVGDNTRVTTSTSITDTVGTANRKIENGKIIDTADDSTVTTENGKGTTFTKTGSTAYSTAAGAPTDTNIAGNHITTGRVDANELGVSDKDDQGNTAGLSVKAGEGNKGGIKGYATDKDGNKTYMKVTATENSFQVQDKDGKNKNHQVNTKDSSENTITNGDKTNTVTSTADGTTFNNSKANTAFEGGTYKNTTIKGNTITTGKVTMDYADVMKDLGVHGNANITGKTTTGSLEVKGESKLTGDVTMENNATVGNNLTVNGTTKTKTLNVTENAEVGGELKVAKKATFEDSVSIAKDLTVGGDVTAKSYKVGDKTYIDANGIHANGQKITDVADGSISEGSKDAVNGGQLYTVKNDLEGKVNKVGANAAAMANLHPMEFDPDSKWNIAAAIGNYGSETAAALGAFYRPNDDVMVNLSTAFGTGENMVGGGVSVRLGKGGNKLSREESNALKDQVNDLTARMDALLSVLNPNMSKDFPDVPENHWAYEAVSRLAGNDIVQGYPDGEFHGDRTMTRYEMAEIIYNALSRGAEAEKELVEEFKPELQAMAASEKATAERAEG